MLKLCPNCSDAHSKPGLFCSRSCANRRTFSAKSNEKKSRAAIQYYELVDRDSAIWSQRISKLRCIRHDNRPKTFDELSLKLKKAFVIESQGYKCLWCDISVWRGQPIGLQLDHIDGDRTNDSRSNLRALCPNCHSQTETWCGKNITRKDDYVTDSMFIDALKVHRSTKAALESLGLAVGGGNYRRAKKLLATISLL